MDYFPSFVTKDTLISVYANSAILIILWSLTSQKNINIINVSQKKYQGYKSFTLR